METIVLFGLTFAETGLGLLLFVLIAVGLTLNSKRRKPTDGENAGQLTALIESLTGMKEDQTKLRGQIEHMSKGQETARLHLSQQFQAQEREIKASLEKRLAEVTQKVGENLQKTTEKTSESLTDLQKRLAVIDAAQKNITDLSTDIVGLQDILSNKQARGAFGQIQMEDIVRDMLPADYFAFESTLSNGKRVDCLITLPGSHGAIGVDSKYPHEAYVRLMEATNDEDRKSAGKEFTRDVIKHVQDIADKYIIPGETSEWALMFVPAESIYMELHTNFLNVIQEGQRRKIVVASPSSLWAILHAVRALIRDSKMREQAGLIQKEVDILMKDVTRLDKRVGNLSQHFKLANKDIEEIQTSAHKIVSHGNKIKQVELQEDEAPSIADTGEEENAGGIVTALNDPRSGT
jgi:DNA recombination protein RmuC